MLTATKSQSAVDDSATSDGAVLDLNQYLHNVKVSKTLIAQADDLAMEHERFHTNYVIAGRMALYALLGKIYELVLKVESSVDCEFFVDQMRNSLKSKHSIRTQENSSTAAIVVRYVTRADRKTAHVYARAIESARQNGIASSNFVSYVEQAGGVERIRSNAVVTPESEFTEKLSEDELEDMLELTRDYLRARSELPLGSFKSPKIAHSNIEQSAFNHFICHERNGRQYVLARFNVSKKRENELVEDFAKELCEDTNAAKKNIGKFYKKAMAKRKKRTMKEISKQRPELGIKLKATGRWS